ncbi:DUF29 family protein [Moorena sp. SIO4G3]|uniref:DUF29 family protein n=1 Tax=Moorena sp. SIO4G3 TaxID=2607821 RepID=UPI0025F9F985|nr:DUF29 family protein [Moorena sp. SIO4G3]
MSNSDLYDQDFVLWTETTCQQLKTRNFDELDIDNLIEEIASLGGTGILPVVVKVELASCQWL